MKLTENILFQYSVGDIVSFASEEGMQLHHPSKISSKMLNLKRVQIGRVGKWVSCHNIHVRSFSPSLTQNPKSIHSHLVRCKIFFESFDLYFLGFVIKSQSGNLIPYHHFEYLTLSSQLQKENVNSHLIFMFQELSNIILRVQFG